MTRRRFYAPPEAFSPDGAGAELSAEETRHLRQVLRLQTGDEIHLFDGAGREFQGQIQAIARNSTAVKVIAPVDAASPESALDLTLGVALLKGEKFDLVIQKATELGVQKLVPVSTARADVRLKNDEDAQRKLVRWQRIALEATKQCGRARLMRVEMPVNVRQFVRSPESADLRLLFAERDGSSFAGLLTANLNPKSLVTLIGPEGGWADDEIEQAGAADWKIVTLGGRTLRAETAAIAITALLQHRFGDLV